VRLLSYGSVKNFKCLVLPIIIDVRIIRAQCYKINFLDIHCVLAKSRRGELCTVTPVKQLFTVSLLEALNCYTVALNNMHGLAD